jgi:serine/threonine protein phosphatase PrpC
MRSLGVRQDVEVDVAPLDLRPQDAYLLCSDGLNSMLADEDLKSIAERATDPHTVVAWMIDAANQAGGMDNVTAMVAQIHEPTSEAEPSSD